jgi:hypothetical protein
MKVLRLDQGAKASSYRYYKNQIRKARDVRRVVRVDCEALRPSLRRGRACLVKNSSFLFFALTMVKAIVRLALGTIGAAQRGNLEAHPDTACQASQPPNWRSLS